MNTIEIIGYLAIYLFLGWATLPIYKAMVKNYGEWVGNTKLPHIFFWILFWPPSIFAMVALLWIRGLEEELESDD